MAAREEDKAMAGLLRRSLAQDAGSRSGEDCPEPEILAAYFDHALDAQETAHYDLHFSRCSHCREQLAAMARVGSALTARDAEKKTASGWDWLTGSRWLMPAAAALVALLVISGIALRMKKAVVPANEIAMARPDAVPPANSVPPTNSAPSPEVAPSGGCLRQSRQRISSLSGLPPRLRTSRRRGKPCRLRAGEVRSVPSELSRVARGKLRPQTISRGHGGIGSKPCCRSEVRAWRGKACGNAGDASRRRLAGACEFSQ